jgi:hypothetical protein
MRKKKTEDLCAIRARIAHARAQIAKWKDKHDEALAALAAAKDADFLGRVQVALDADAQLTMRMPERTYVDFASMRTVTDPACTANIVRVHRGTMHRGLWVRYAGASNVQFVPAAKFRSGRGPMIDGIPYPECEKGDRR